MAKVSVSKCDIYDKGLVNDAIMRSLDLIGIDGAFFHGKKVLIKPNLLGPFNPEQCVTTHPSIIEGLIKTVREFGGIPIIGESPGSGFVSAVKTFQATGIMEVAESTETPLMDFASDRLQKVYIKGRFFETVYLPESVLKADVIISVPKFKTHSLTTFTGAVKNMFGVVPGNLKADFHRKAQRPDELSEAIADLFAHVRPHLSIMDAVIGMEGEGPSAGSPRKLGYIMASSDAVSLDAVCAEMIGLEWDFVDILRIASERGLGVGDINEIDIIGSRLEDVRIKGFKLPQAAYIEKALNNWIFSVSSYDWLRPRVTEKMCTGCATCDAGCPADAIKMENHIPHFDYEKCIRCYCCQELCPEHAIELKVDRSKKIMLKTIGGIAKASRLARELLTK